MELVREARDRGGSVVNVASLPDDHVVYVPGHGETTLGAIRGVQARMITTVEAAALFSYKPETWAGWAKDGLIEGAYRDRLWRLPVEACQAHIRAQRLPRRRRRAPWPPKTATTHAAPVRSAALPKG